MSQENVDAARRGFEAFNRTFTEGTPDLFQTLDPEIEWVPMSAWLVQHRNGSSCGCGPFTDRKEAVEAAGLSEIGDIASRAV
jgi:hypothetical protein